MDLLIEMKLGNCNVNENDLIVFADADGRQDLVGFHVIKDGDMLPLSEKELDPNNGNECFFHINKAQTKALINYLQTLYDNMG